MKAPDRNLAILLFVMTFGMSALLAGCLSSAPVSGDVCSAEEEEPCGFGGDCIGERCQTRCPCEPGWVCRKRRPSDPFSNEFCYLPCSAEEACPDGWGCASDETGVCEYPPPVVLASKLDFDVYCPDSGVVGEVITCGYTINSQSGDITGTKWTVTAPSTGGGAGEILGADDQPQVEFELTLAGPLHVLLGLSDEESNALETVDLMVAESP